MRTHRTLPLPLLLLATSVLLTGARGGSCGGTATVEELPPRPPPPPPPACATLDEAACNMSSACEAVYVDRGSCACTGGGAARPCGPGDDCGAPDPIPEPCDCPPPERVFDQCRDRDPCEGLDEAACNADPACEALYAPTRGDALCAPDHPRCGGTGTGYAGCYTAPVDCPAVACTLYCEFGFATGADGCPECSCNPPPPDGCSGLSEGACIDRAGCHPIYGDEGEPCACAPGEDCACTGGGSGGSSGERPDAGSSDGGASDGGSSGGARAPECDCDPSVPDCGCGNPRPAPPPHEYLGCEPDAPPPVGCARLDEESCRESAACEPIYVTESCSNECDPNEPHCSPDGFRPCDPVIRYAGCQDRRPMDECRSDADCPNGYCEQFASCAGLGCPPPPPAQCVYPQCGDGSALACRALPPTCAAGETLGVVNGCWACLDARSCGLPGPIGCDDGGEVLCDALPPECPAGTQVAARNGCWSCVEPITCQEVVCHDGSQALCEIVPPVCGPGAGLAIRNNCYACVNPLSCQ